MAHTVKRNGDSKSIAVIRSYHPIRIERELLAQVFDLAERGQAAGGFNVDGQSLGVEQIDDQPTKQLGIFAQCASQQFDELEAVA